MKDKILDILEEFQVNEENQSGVKGNVIRDVYFEIIATRLVKLLNLHNEVECSHPRSQRTYIGMGLLKCGKCGEEFH